MPDNVRPGVRASVNPQSIQPAPEEVPAPADTLPALATVTIDTEMTLSPEELRIVSLAMLGWRSTLHRTAHDLGLERTHPSNMLNPRPSVVIEKELADAQDMLQQIDAVLTKLGIIVAE